MNTVHNMGSKGKFQCDQCSYSANRKDQVKQHVRFNHTSMDLKNPSVKRETFSSLSKSEKRSISISSRRIHKTGGRRNPNRKWQYFLRITNIWGSNNFGFRTVEIRNFTWLRQKILWYNLKIPAPAINDILSTSRRWSPYV